MLRKMHWEWSQKAIGRSDHHFFHTGADEDRWIDWKNQTKKQERTSIFPAEGGHYNSHFQGAVLRHQPCEVFRGRYGMAACIDNQSSGLWSSSIYNLSQSKKVAKKRSQAGKLYFFNFHYFCHAVYQWIHIRHVICGRSLLGESDRRRYRKTHCRGLCCKIHGLWITLSGKCLEIICRCSGNRYGWERLFFPACELRNTVMAVNQSTFLGLSSL